MKKISGSSSAAERFLSTLCGEQCTENACLENEYVGRGKWAYFGRQDSPGKSNFSETLRVIGTSVVNQVPKNTGEKCADQFGNRSVSPKKNRISDFLVSLPFNVFYIRFNLVKCKLFRSFMTTS